MCGIAGQVKLDGAVDPELVDRMCEAIKHRGPDCRGTFTQGRIGLGSQRLRVIDLVTGDQPIFNEDRSIAVVLNGEIYNYHELRKRLEARGHRFSTEGDTETIAHLYEEQGLDCVTALHGMFAFALWDARAQMLMLARDRVGKKPLFYSLHGEGLSFASEIRALLEDGHIQRTIDYQSLDCYHAYQYIPTSHCAFAAVRKLAPATVLTYRDGSVVQRRYWRLRYYPKPEARDPREVHEQIREVVDAAVKRRMISDVPIGAFLSGGIDSSAVVAAMTRHSSNPVKTFSIGFADARFNELPYARMVANRFGTDHHEFLVEPSAISILPKVVRHYGEPFADASVVPSFYLSELTRRHVTVALNGDGGDESFAGYNRYLSNLIATRLDALPISLRRYIACAADRIACGPDPQSRLMRARRLARSLSLTPAQRYARHMSCFDFIERETLYTDEYRALLGGSVVDSVIEVPWAAASGQSVVDVMLETDVETYLPGDLLVKMDIATMAHSLEARSPLLDHAVMELAASLPASWKLRGTQKKAVFRDALSEWLPREWMDRPKMGFAVPIGTWFRNQLRTYAEDVLLDPATLARGYYRTDAVERLLRKHFDGSEDNSSRIWTLLMCELWHRELVDA